VNIKAQLNKNRTIIMSVVNVLLIAAVVYGFMSWLQGRKQY